MVRSFFSTELLRVEKVGVQDAVKSKVGQYLKKTGYVKVRKIIAVMSGDSTVKINLDLSPADHCEIQICTDYSS